MRGKGPYRIHTYSDAQSFDQLAEAWHDLTDRDKNCTVFQTWTWVSQMWKLDSQGHVSPQLMAVFGEDDRLVALAPLLIERRFGPLNVRVLRFIGHRLSDRQDIIIASDANEKAIIDLLAEWFLSTARSHDIIILDNLSENSRIVRHWEALFTEQRFTNWHMDPVDEYFYVPVVGSWEEYCTSLKKSVRHAIRRRKRRLEADHALTIWVEDGSIDPSKSIAEFVKLHQLRQESKKERGLFHTNTRKRLLSQLYHAILKDGQLKLLFISVDGSPKAVQAVLEFNNHSHWYNVGLDSTPSILRLGLGKLLCFIALENAFVTKKAVVDLGGGIQSYKADFTSQRSKLYRILGCYSPTKGFLYRVYGRCYRKFQYSKWVRRLYFLGRRLIFSLWP